MVDEAVDVVVVESLLDALDDSVALKWSEQPVATFKTKSAEVIVSFTARSDGDWDVNYSVRAKGGRTVTEVIRDVVAIHGGVIRAIETFVEDREVTTIYVGKEETELKAVYQAYQRRKDVPEST